MLSSGGCFEVFWGLFWHITSNFWEPFNILSWNFVQTFLVFLLRVAALFFSISWSCWGALGGIFGLIWTRLFIWYFITIQFFLMKIFTGVLGITLIITNTKTFFDAMSLSSAGGDILGYSEGLLWHITATFWEPFNMFSWNFVQTFLVLLWESLHYFFFHIMALLGSLRMYFWAHFGEFSSNTSEPIHMFSWNFVQVSLV